MVQEWYNGMIEDEGLKWFIGKTVDEVWEQYLADSGDDISVIGFGMILKALLPKWIGTKVKKVNGKSTRVYVDNQSYESLKEMIVMAHGNGDINGCLTKEVYFAFCVDEHNEYYTYCNLSQEEFTRLVVKVLKPGCNSIFIRQGRYCIEDTALY